MFIQTETTPNPLTLKFVPGVPVMPSGTMFYTKKEDAGNSPLATALFAQDNVEAVFLSSDFITITKSPEATWDVMKPALLTTIMDHFVAGREVISSDATAVAGASLERRPMGASEDATGDNEIISQIKELIETRVRPAVAQDGGDIIFRDFKDGVVSLELHGACSGCPSSTITLKNGIENMLKHYVPEVLSVEAVE